MLDSIHQMQEVEISGKRHEKAITGSMSGRLDLQIDKLQSLPKFLGTVDLFRTIQLTPGVQTTGELNSGLYIRGGDAGHNQILFNGATIYNPMHLLGFFSIFNNDHITSASLMKSYISPQYGGRLSGTVDVASKSSPAKEVSVRGNIGLICSQGTLETPAGKNGALYLSGRGTYINLLLDLIQLKGNIQPQYGFQDYNLTYSLRPSERSKLLLNVYGGKDELAIKEYYYQADGKISWQNVAASLVWEQKLRNGHAMSHTLHYSYYNNKVEALLGQSLVQFPSRIQDIGYRGSYKFQWLNGYWTAGIDYVRHAVNPQYPDIKDLFSIGSTSQPSQIATHEYGIYLQGDFPLTPEWSLRTGLRYSGSAKENPAGIAKSLLPAPQKNRPAGRYGGIEPRGALEYEWQANRKFILSYTLQRQYMNQVIVSGIGLPTDFWLPASEYVPAQHSHNVSLGYFHSFANDDYEISIEGYYKYLSNQLEFNGELLDMVNQTYRVEEHLYYGKGQSYGVEVMFKKNSGRLNGWVSYTIGKSTRQFPLINGGRTFPAKNDRRHDLSVVANYKLNKRWDLSGVFVCASGSAFTMPTALYLIGENAINEYGPHNGARMPLYHRLDLSGTYWFRKDRKRESMLNISLYNAYARANPIFLSIKVKPDKDERTLRVTPKGQSLYSLLPSISYAFKF